MISPSRQLLILLREGIDTDGHKHNMASLAAKSGLSAQALAKMLSGKTRSPRLLTIRAVCAVYALPIDYFDCDTEAACRAWLERHHRTRSPLIAEIARIADQLSPHHRHSLNAVIRWLDAGTS